MTALRRRIGFRGATLLFLALVDGVYSLSLAAPAAEVRRGASIRWVEQILPLWAWAILWGAVGAICLGYAFARRDRVAFAAAVPLKVLWGLVAFGGWLLADVERGWVSAAIWLGFAAWAWLVAYWPEPPHTLAGHDGEGRRWTPRRPSR